MADIFSKEKRSEIMSKIRGKDTKIEVQFRKQLSSVVYPLGLRYRKHYKKIPGSPDIVFVKQKIAIFIDGDFWHGYDFENRRKKLPKKYWVKKIQDNMARDVRNTNELKRMGWRVMRFWEHQVKKCSNKIVSKIFKQLQK